MQVSTDDKDDSGDGSVLGSDCIFTLKQIHDLSQRERERRNWSPFLSFPVTRRTVVLN